MTDPYLPGRGDDRHRVGHYDLDLDYRPSTNALAGRAVLSVVPLVETPTVALDLLAGLGVDKVTVDGRPVRWRHRADRVTVTLPAATSAPFSLHIRWSGAPRPRRGPWGEVGWEELTDGVLVAGQPDGASSWFPCNDLPRHKATYRTRVTTDRAYTVVAHGTLVERTSSGTRTSWTYEQDEPTATYLATVQVGRYATEGRGTSVLHAPPHLLERARADLAAQPRMLALFARCFGPYPFPEYAVVVTDDDLEIPLEAQGLSVLGANHVDGHGGSERLVAHELAHQWFGNSLTVAAWQDIWLHEGFACYAEWLWSEESGRTSAADLAAAAHRRQLALPQDLLLSDPGPDRMFDDRVYQRGALAVHAVRTALGDEPFWASLRAWTAAHRHGTVSTPLLRAHLGPVGEAALAPWLDSCALPDPAPPAPAGRR